VAAFDAASAAVVGEPLGDALTAELVAASFDETLAVGCGVAVPRLVDTGRGLPVAGGSRGSPVGPPLAFAEAGGSLGSRSRVGQICAKPVDGGSRRPPSCLTQPSVDPGGGSWVPAPCEA
jgi:hypothetical protein